MGRRLKFYHQDIPSKANLILNLILLAMALILVRVWHLSVIQYDKKLEEARKPQKKVVIEPATRATIRDRFNLPLAINKIQYQAAVLYSQIRDIPSVTWEKDADGKKVKIYKRKSYIKELAQRLAQELNLDGERIEDLIYSKASFYAQVPYVLKEELTEKEYYRLKMLEKDWPGIYVRRIPRRYYPQGRTGADLIGYMGAINKNEYEKILHEIKMLEQVIAQSEQGLEVEFPPNIENSWQARKRLKDLEEKAYTIHDYVGKSGIEGVFEQQLRGFYGKKSFYSDSKGNFLRELPGSRQPLPGHRILLTISAELQEYAEQLLAQNEALRVVRLSHLGPNKKTVLAAKQPWMKGGAIVAMDPQTAEIMALASYPRFDPNDFIASGNPEVNKKKKGQINRWFENETYLANLWNQQQPLEREVYKDKFEDEQKILDWNAYLDFILPEEGTLRVALKNSVYTLGHALEIQNQVDKLKQLVPNASLYQLMNYLYANEPYGAKLSAADKKGVEGQQAEVKAIKKALDPYLEKIPQNYDKVLLVDLCRLAVCHTSFSADLTKKVKNISLITYKNTTGQFVTLMAMVKLRSKELFHEIDFSAWRKREEKAFLKEKRNEEKLAKTYPRPYLDYLDKQEQAMFKAFWERHKWDLFLAFLTGKNHADPSVPFETENLDQYVTHFAEWHEGIDTQKEWHSAYAQLQQMVATLTPPFAIQYFQTLRPYQDLNRPLFGKYRFLRNSHAPLEKHLAAAFYPNYGFGYGRSYGYRQAAIQGSIFKLVTAYEALVQHFRKLNRKDVSQFELNPLTINDQVYSVGDTHYVGYTQDGKPIPQLYKGGRLPRSLAHRHNGEVNLIKALEVSSNPYFSLLAGECLEKPEDLSEAARLFSYGSKTGIQLPGEIAGNVPNDLATNRTGLYAMAIGQHSLVVTPLQTAVMLAAIANGGKVLKPKIVSLTAGRLPVRGMDSITCLPDFSYQESLAYVGIDFPLYTAVSLENQKSLIKRIPTEVKDEVFMPQVVRQVLLLGLRSATNRTHQESMTSLARLYQQYPEAIREFSEMKSQLLGKTSTSESVETIDLDLNEGTNLYTHVWFGSIAFQKDNPGKGTTTFLFKDEFGKPELVVVVYLRYGGYGKEAAPLAAQMVKKWRELKQKYHSN